MSFDGKLERSLKKEFRKKGYTWQDVDEINRWFMRTMPKMLKEYRETTREIPIMLIEKLIGEQAWENDNDVNFKIWTDILDEMLYLFTEADIEKCSMENKYEEELKQAIRNFYNENSKRKKELGKKWIEHCIDRCDVDFDDHEVFLSNENNKKINDLYVEEQEKIVKYTKKCQKEALEMFVKYFDYLES